MPANEDLNLGIQVAKLQSDVTHIQSDVTDIKADLRSQRREIGEVKDSVASAKVWALWLYIGLAGSLFYALGHGFKWF